MSVKVPSEREDLAVVSECESVASAASYGLDELQRRDSRGGRTLANVAETKTAVLAPTPGVERAGDAAGARVVVAARNRRYAMRGETGNESRDDCGETLWGATLTVELVGRGLGRGEGRGKAELASLVGTERVHVARRKKYKAVCASAANGDSGRVGRKAATCVDLLR